MSSILGELTGLKLNLSVSDPCIQTQGVVQKNDNIYLNGALVDLSNITGATGFFDTDQSGTVTIGEVVAKVEGVYGDAEHQPQRLEVRGITKGDQSMVISVLTGINEGYLVMSAGTGPTGLCPI